MRPLPLASVQIVSHPAWTAARDAVLHALHGPPGVFPLLGSPGTGKTMLLHELDRILRAGGREVVLLPRGDQEVDPAPGTTVLVDEADRMDARALEALAARDDLHLVLAALPGFAARLPGVRPIRLTPLLPEEAASFLRARTAQSDHRPDMLTEEAVEAIVRHAEGAPRVLNALLGLSVFTASLDGAERVTAAHVAQAMEFRDLEAEVEADADADPLPPPEPPPAGAAATAPVAPAPAPAFASVPLPGPASAPSAPLSTASAPGRRRWAAALLLLLVLGAGGVAPALLRPEAGHAGVEETEVPAPVAATSVAPAPLPAPASPAAPAPEPALPARPLARVVLTYSRGDAEAARQSQEVARVLRAAGIAAGDPVPVGRRPVETILRYFFPQDRDRAAEIGRALGGRFGDGTLDPPARDGTLPRPGTVEIMLASD